MRHKSEKQRLKILFITLLSLGFSTTQLAFSGGITMEELSKESIYGLERRYPRIIPHVRQVMGSEPDVLEKAESGPIETFKQLNFTKLEQRFFPKGAWYPGIHTFEDPRLRLLFQPYTNHQFTQDPHLIFLANVLYEVGYTLHTQDQEEYPFLELAAAIGHAKAQFQMFLVASKQEKFEEAKSYIFCAAAQGNTDALSKLSYYFDVGKEKRGYAQDRSLARLLCQAGANQGDLNALFELQVSTYTEGMFGQEKDFQQGVRNAKTLADAGNERAKTWIESMMQTSRDAMEEGEITDREEDFAFLKAFLGWEGDEEI